MKINISKFAALIFIFIFAELAHAQSESAAALYNKANSLYEQGKYDEAIAEYTLAINSGAKDSRLEYNLGNAYLKKTPSDIGRAILHYERARLFDPRDPDLLYNLEFANSQIKNKPPVGDLTYFQITWGKLMRLSSRNESTAVFSVIYIILITLIIIRIFVRDDRKKLYINRAAMIVGIILILDIPLFAGKLRSDSNPEAVIIEQALKARSGPGETNPELFNLPAGVIVYRRECRGDWCHIEVPGGLAGWVAVNGIEPVK